MLEEEIKELRISVNILTKGLGVVARAICESGETTAEPIKQTAAKPEKTPPQSSILTVDEVRAVFTKAAKSKENRQKLREILNTYGGEKLDDIAPDDLPIVKVEAEALAA